MPTSRIVMLATFAIVPRGAAVTELSERAGAPSSWPPFTIECTGVAFLVRRGCGSMKREPGGVSRTLVFVFSPFEKALLFDAVCLNLAQCV